VLMETLVGCPQTQKKWLAIAVANHL
jgi:hypothetical protein